MFELTSRYSILISLILLLAAAAASFFFYRKSSLTKAKRYILIAIKTAGIFLIMVLLIEPSILALVNSSREPLNIVLIDNSRSNNLPFDNGSKSSQIKNIFNQLKVLRTNPDKFRIFKFSSGETGGGISNPDSLEFACFETNLTAAFGDLRGKFPDDIYNSLTVISDGIFNAGGNPLYAAKTFQCPVTTIGIGDTVQQKDIVINNVLYNEKAFTESSNRITAVLKAYGFMNELVKVSLFREGVLTSVKEVTINNNQWNTDVTFDVSESEPGTIRYRIAADNKPGEITYKNNNSDFLIEYLPNKTKILFVSGGPGYDNAVMSNIIKRIRNYEAAVKTAKSANDFYEGPIDLNGIGELSAVVLRGYPTAQSNSEMVSSLAEKVRTFNIPLIVFSDKNTDYRKLEQFDESVPFTIAKTGSGEQTVTVQTTSAATEYDEILQGMKSLPPLYRNQGSVIQKPGSQVLLIDRNSGEPILITRSAANRKSTAFLGYGFWKWRLNPNNDYESSLEKLLLAIVNMSLLKEKKSKLTVVPDKNFFDYSENAEFTAEVYDDNFNPIRNAVIRAKMYSGHSVIKSELTFRNTGNKYRLDAGFLAAGDYRIEAEVDVNGNYYAKDGARFVIDTLNLEYKITASNFENLKLLPDNTNGKFFPGYRDIDSVNGFIQSLLDKKDNVQYSQFEHINLWQNKYFLLAAIFLFAVEWVIRKRNNIP